MVINELKVEEVTMRRMRLMRRMEREQDTTCKAVPSNEGIPVRSKTSSLTVSLSKA